MKFRALYWWVDRWRKSTAFTDMTLEEQGAYRNLLDEATLRGGALPFDERAIAKASGDAVRWPKLRAVVMKRFTKKRDGWHNDTLDSVLRVTANRADRQARYRERHEGFAFGSPQPKRNDGHNATHNAGRVSGSGSGSGSGSTDQDPDLARPIVKGNYKQ
jgi:uncharacterized protein YdaU (DUF1376 family)